MSQLDVGALLRAMYAKLPYSNWTTAAQTNAEYLAAEYDRLTLDAARTTPVDGETLRAAIDKACSLTNPRLSEVDWDDVAAALATDNPARKPER